MPAYDDQQLYNALSELGIITADKLTQSLTESKANNIPLETVIIEKDLLSDEDIGRTIADIVSLPLVRLGDLVIPKDVLQLIPEVVAKSQHIIAYKKDGQGLYVAMTDPSNIQIRNFLQKKVGMPIKVGITTHKDLNDSLFLYAKDLSATFDQIIKENIEKEKGGAVKQNDPPIIKIVDTIITYAYRNKASDIHIEPRKNRSLLRFRIDGILHDITTLPLALHKPIMTRIKVLSDLRTDEHQAAQDGKISYKVELEDLDIRVSFVPIVGGEKVVMRLLSVHSHQFSLLDLGFSPADLEKVKMAYEKPYGMILSTGPTGSGKTTTIYSILKLLNKRGVNIMTIEDPVEYEIDGINHIQVNPKTNLTFVEGLRSIVRQDPNVILVGEIRDAETADIAINSAMTGHLVLSTLHTNDATTTIPRLFDMGIEPFLVASTVNVIIAQRLVRKIHAGCRMSELVNTPDIKKQLNESMVKKVFGTGKSIRLYKGKGCEIDHQTGYEGRVGIFEILLIGDELRTAIISRQDTGTLRSLAIKSGMITMMEDGLEKVKQGITTIDEVLRVTRE